MNILTMRESDYKEAFHLWNQTDGMGLRSLDDSESGISLFLKRNPNTNFICRINGILVGVILCGHDGRRGYIYHAAVDKNYREKGIGKLLVEQVLISLDKEGIKKAALVVYSNNELGNKFWSNLGFSERVDLVYRNKVIDSSNI